MESIALIHKNLYQKNNLAAIEMKDYLTKLSQNLSSSYNKEEAVNVNIDMDEIELDVDTAIPLGLIANEVLTNSFKYAFPNENYGIISLSLKKLKDSKLKLQIQDNGIGKQEDSKENFGTQLIELLSKQINGILTTGNENGYKTEIVF